MSHLTMVATVAFPAKPGFSQHIYATVDVSNQGSQWVWIQVDQNGRYLGSPSSGFPTEEDAENDALAKLHGDDWV